MIFFGNLWLGTYELGSESYDVYIKAREDFLKTYEYKLAPGYSVINRYNRQYSFMLFANLQDKSLGTAVEEIESFLRNTLPPGYTFEPTGATKEFKRAFAGLAIALIVAVSLRASCTLLPLC